MTVVTRAMRTNKAGRGDRERWGGSVAPLIRWHAEAWMKEGREPCRPQSADGLWILTAECGGSTEIIFIKKILVRQWNTEDILFSFHIFWCRSCVKGRQQALGCQWNSHRSFHEESHVGVGEGESYWDACVCMCVCIPTPRKLPKTTSSRILLSPMWVTQPVSNQKAKISWFSEVCLNTPWQRWSTRSLIAYLCK